MGAEFCLGRYNSSFMPFGVYTDRVASLLSCQINGSSSGDFTTLVGERRRGRGGQGRKRREGEGRGGEGRRGKERRGGEGRGGDGKKQKMEKGGLTSNSQKPVVLATLRP